MLRLAPSQPPLWRTTSSVQLGAEGAVRIDDITGWQELLLDALREGVPDAMVMPMARSMGAPAAQAEAFVAGIRAVLVPGPGDPLAVQAELPSGLGHTERDGLAHGWHAANLDVGPVTRWAAEAPDAARTMIVVAERLVEPRRAAALLSADIPHLPILLAGDRVTVGPLVIPGVTACLACLHEHRIDADPAWPTLAAQLVGRESMRTDPALVLEAAVLSGRLLHAVRQNPDARASLSVTLSSGDVRRIWRAHRPHERCLCRSPEGIATSAAVAPTHPPRLPAPTTTATRIDRPA